MSVTRRVLGFCTVLLFATAISSLSVPLSPAQRTDESPPPGYPARGCDYDQRGDKYCWGGPAPVDKFAAVAFSNSTLRSGISHGEDSQNEAEELALTNCRSRASDCKLLGSARNTCFALATSAPEGAYAVDYDDDRTRAQNKAIEGCRENGKQCVVQASPCASDDPRYQFLLPSLSPSSSGDPIVGCYHWFNGGAVAIRPDHTLVGGPFTASWQRINSAQRAYTFTWPQPATSKVTISADMRSLSGGNQYGGKDSATRIAGNGGLVGTWNWFDLVASKVTINSDGTFSAVSSSATWRGTWQLVKESSRTYTLTMSDAPKDNVTLAVDGSRVSGSDQYGIAISGVRAESCP